MTSNPLRAKRPCLAVKNRLFIVSPLACTPSASRSCENLLQFWEFLLQRCFPLIWISDLEMISDSNHDRLTLYARKFQQGFWKTNPPYYVDYESLRLREENLFDLHFVLVCMKLVV